MGNISYDFWLYFHHASAETTIYQLLTPIRTLSWDRLSGFPCEERYLGELKHFCQLFLSDKLKARHIYLTYWTRKYQLWGDLRNFCNDGCGCNFTVTSWCGCDADVRITLVQPYLHYRQDYTLFCSSVVLDQRVGLTMDVLSPFISVLCYSVHVLMLSIQAMHGLPCLRAPGLASFSRQLPRFLMVWP